VRQGISVPNFAVFGSAQAVADISVAAENAGWDGVFVWDHVVRREGDYPVVDPWVALTAVALATQRVQLGPMITPLARRRPWNVAKAAVSIDVLSRGRFILGVGLGTPRGPEFPAFGEQTDLRVRGDMLDEGIAVIRAAWSGEAVNHVGQHFRVDDVRFLPTPARVGGIPIWAATERISGRPIRRAATLDGIVPTDVSPEDFPTLLDNLARLRGDLTGFDIVVVSQDGDADSWQKAGATWWLHELAWQQSYQANLALVAAGPR
jgi:alkanesulfonate monooxygenase SsuD/methylene tetrahydromethanopterin reductase-like flavin-dependent oxidoreductase (luciferase family)